tara:strand:- start:2337 stop:3233 length:897 start_codon:yes stop_codon:yes gene_type:complete
MYILANILILLITIFLYINIYFNLNTSDYLEIYEIDNISKEKFEELCNIKQPLFFDCNKLDINLSFPDINIDYLKKIYGNFDILLFDNNNQNLGIPVDIISAYELFKKDLSNNYISEYNYNFLEETTLIKSFKTYDYFLRPLNVTNTFYDIICGSLNSYTKLKYSLNYRNIFYVNEGSVEITLTPPCNKKFLHVNNYNDDLEYYSDIDIFNIDEKYNKDFNKVKFLRKILNKGQFISIPAYWFYSIKILEHNTLISSYKYRTYSNNLAILPTILHNFLKRNNIKRNFIKVVSNDVETI